MPLKRKIEQDYIVAGRQHWLDGIVTGPGVVRQVNDFPLNIFFPILICTIVRGHRPASRLYSGRASHRRGESLRHSIRYLPATQETYWDVPRQREDFLDWRSSGKYSIVLGAIGSHHFDPEGTRPKCGAGHTIPVVSSPAFSYTVA